MRPDQYIRLQALSEKVADVALFDGDPDNWVGAGIPARDLDKDQRGDAYWCRKVATATFAVLWRVNVLIEAKQESSPKHDEQEGDRLLEHEIAAAEAEGARLLDQVQRQSKKSKFDARLHGKS